MNMNELYKEPLLHFLIIGVLIFVLFFAVNKEEDIVVGNKIVVSKAKIEQLNANWAKQWNRPPTDTELNGLVEAYIKEEVYYREALALGLDKNDTVLKRRLMQKMEFLSDDLAELIQPDDEALNKYFIENQEEYSLPARVSFTQIYFSLDKRGVKAFDDAKDILSKHSSTEMPEQGDSSMLQNNFTETTPYEVARIFGKDFAEQLFTSDTNT
ncbi:MAG: peptidyl-prolyl cis-trans isomerase C [Planctomycetota bacterium]|jgi:peptidyl-prolyl cis-trans isomerase C